MNFRFTYDELRNRFNFWVDFSGCSGPVVLEGTPVFYETRSCDERRRKSRLWKGLLHSVISLVRSEVTGP